MRAVIGMMAALLAGCAAQPRGPACTEWPGVTYRYVGAVSVQAECGLPYRVYACARRHPDGTYTVIMPRRVSGPGDRLCGPMDHENAHTTGLMSKHVPPRRLGRHGWER